MLPKTYQIQKTSVKTNNDFWGLRGSILALSWANLGQVGPTWPQLGPTWLQFGPNLAPTWTNLAQLGPDLAPIRPQLGPIWASLGYLCEAPYFHRIQYNEPHIRSNQIQCINIINCFPQISTYDWKCCCFSLCLLPGLVSQTPWVPLDMRGRRNGVSLLNICIYIYI